MDHRFLALSLVFILVACADSDLSFGDSDDDRSDAGTTAIADGGAEVSQGDGTLGASFRFPSLSALTEDTEITLRGVSSAATGVAEVTVNGTAVSTDTNFSTWSVTLPLELGENAFSIAARDNIGGVNTGLDSVTVTRRYPLKRTLDAELVSASSELYHVDSEAFAIRSIDLATGLIRPVADVARFAPEAEVVGQRPYATVPRLRLGFALDLANDRIFLGTRLDSATSTVGIWSYDVSTNEWAPISDATHGSGPDFLNPQFLFLDVSNGRLLVVDDDLNAVIAMDLTSGNRTVLSSNTVPSTADAFFSEITSADFDEENGRLFVGDAGTDRVFEVDTTTGVRTPISDNSITGEMQLREPVALVFDAAGERLFVHDEGGLRGWVAAIDVATGARTRFYGFPQVGISVLTRSMIVDEANDRLLTVDAAGPEGMVQAVDLGTAQGTVLFHNGFPSSGLVPGARNQTLRSTWYWAGRNSIYYMTTGADQTLLQLGADGMRAPLLGPEFPGTVEPVGIYRGELDEARGMFYALRQDELVAIDLETRSQSRVDGPATDEAIEAFDHFSGHKIAVDRDRNRLYVLTNDARIVSVDLSDGGRAILADFSRDDLPPRMAPAPADLALDAINDRIVLVDRNGRDLVAVDPSTGAQTELTPPSAHAWTVPERVAVSPDGSIWVLDAYSRVFRVDPATYEGVLISGPTTPDQINVVGSADKVIASELGVFVSGGANGLLGQVDPISGRRVYVHR